MKNEHPAFFPREQDDIVNSLNYEGIAIIELQFYHFPDSDRLRVEHMSDYKQIWMVNSYDDREINEIILHDIIDHFTNMPQLLWMLPETPYVLYMQLQHQGNS